MIVLHTACERCRMRTHQDELTHYEPSDEYLCENCLEKAAEEHRQKREANPDEA